jgi:hypothetical protein
MDSQGNAGPNFEVLAHPLRLRIVEVCTEWDALSPTEIRDRRLCDDVPTLEGKTSKQKLSTIAYHCRILAEAEVLTEHTVPGARGFPKHIYSANREAIFSDDEWSILGKADREALSLVMWQRFFAAVQIAMKEGTFDSRLDRMLAWGPLVLDEQGWKELAAHMAQAFLAVENGIKERAERRLTQPGSTAMRAMYGFFAFEAPMPRLAR